MRTLATTLTVTALALAAAPACGAGPEDLVRKITSAAPTTAPAQPARPRKVLVLNFCRGFKHASIPVAAKAVEILGTKTGAFTVIESDDPGALAADNLKQFDAVCLNNNTGEFFAGRPDEAALKKSLLDFVASGKGLIGIHAATDSNYKWAEFGKMIGGYFASHPWNEKVPIKLDDPASPINAAFAGAGFEIADEIYTFRDQPYSRAKLRVLLSLDMDRIAKKAGRKDGDNAVSWVRRYGQGRVFYCSLGHRNEVFTTPAVLAHYLAGIQYALGDLKADHTPSAATTTQPDEAGFRPLFNGKDLAGWTLKEGSWVVEEGGVLARRGGGNVWTAEQFDDFVLDLEFKIVKGSNSGVFFRTGNTRDEVQTGIELQVYDTVGKAPTRNSCGAVYDCVAPSRNVEKPVGEWNRVVLTCRGPKITVVMNGEPIIDMDLDRWTQARRNPDGTPNKFRTAYKDMPRRGFIGFQDHGNAVWYRNIRIKVVE